MSALSAAAFIAAFLVLIPLPSHWRARNVATVAIIAWLFVINIIYGVNTAIWAHSVDNYIPVWCDITTKIIIGTSTALPACTLCICKHLELVASSRVVRLTEVDKRRRMVFESIMCFGVPAIFMALHYVVQGHRFDIVEQFGCEPATYFSIPAIFIVWFMPLLLSTITMIYAALAFWHFFRKRVNFATHLAHTGSSLNTARYMRLMAMSVAEMVWGTSLTAFTLYVNIAPGLEPWISWDNVHSDFSRVDLYATLVLPLYYRQQLLLLWWAMPASAIIFFIFFGFGTDAMQDYRTIFGCIQRRLPKRAPKGKASLSDSLPIFERRTPGSALKPINVSEDFDDKTLPSYSPPADGKELPSSPSKSELYTGSALTFSDISLGALPTPSTASTTYASSDFGHPISPSDEQAAPLSPPVPHVAIPFPVYHRPFSPPTVCPIPIVQQTPKNEPVVLIVNTDVSHMA